MADTCPHGHDLVDDETRGTQCPKFCADPNCGHNCHWHYGQCCDAGGFNECEQCNAPIGNGENPVCNGWQEPA